MNGARWLAVGAGVSLAAHGALVAGAMWAWAGNGPTLAVAPRWERGAVVIVQEPVERQMERHEEPVAPAATPPVVRVEEPCEPEPVEEVREPAPIVEESVRPREMHEVPAAHPDRVGPAMREWVGRAGTSAAVVAELIRVVAAKELAALRALEPGSEATPAPSAAAEGGVVEAPTPLATNQPPVYPQECRRRREEGTVRVRVHVRADGSAAGAVVETSCGVAALDGAAREAAAGWRFAPAMEGSAAVGADAIVTIRFVLGR